MARVARQPASDDVEAQNTAALAALGNRVRSRRRRLGLTLKDLAARTGLSVPFLSQVENGSGTPSLTSLFTLARELDTVPEVLIAGPRRDDVSVVRAGDGVRFPYSDTEERAVRRQLTGEAEPMSVAEYIVEPGADLGGFQASDGREVLHIISGTLQVELRAGGKVTRHRLSAGDTIAYATSKEHRWRVVGTETTRFVNVVSPTT